MVVVKFESLPVLMKKQTISSDATEIIKHYIGDNKILDLQVHNKWLRATLSSGVKFSILNK